MAGVQTVILDHELYFLSILLGRIDADLGRTRRAKIMAEGAADRLGHDQSDGNGDIGSHGHDRRTDMIPPRGTLEPGPRNRDLPHKIADELLEVHQ